jgi:uncharacterized protein (TIGR03435 family)
MARTQTKVIALTLICISLMAGIAILAVKRDKQTSPQVVTLAPEIWDQYSQVLAKAAADPAVTDVTLKSLNQMMSEQPPAASIRLSQTERLGGNARIGQRGVQGIGTRNGRITMGAYLAEVFAYASGDAPGFTNAISPNRVLVPAELAYNRYDFVDTLPRGGREALRQALKMQFGLVAHAEVRGDLVMTIKGTNAPIFQLKVDSQDSVNRNGVMSMETFAKGLSRLLKVNVSDQTGLSGVYKITLSPPLAPNSSPDEIQHGVTKILGLDLSIDPNGKPVEYVAVEKVR